MCSMTDLPTVFERGYSEMKATTSRALVYIMALALLMLAACADEFAPSSSVPEPVPPLRVESAPSSDTGTVTIEDVAKQVIEFYPGGVAFQYVRQDKISDEEHQDGFVQQECYIFDVNYDGNKVSGVAVGIEDGSIWIKDMLNDTLWLSEEFMGLPRSFAETENSAGLMPPVIELTEQRGPNADTVGLYIAHLNTVPEFGNRCEGYAGWNESEQTITISATKVTGTVTGSPDGPGVKAAISWADGVPEVLSKEFTPAPTYSQPSQVLLSGETLAIADDRLIEIAEYFKDIILDKLQTEGDNSKETPADPALSNPNVVPDIKEGTIDTNPTPMAGDKDGQIYIPGFGWVKDEGGGSKGTKSVGKGSMDKMVGY